MPGELELASSTTIDKQVRRRKSTAPDEYEITERHLHWLEGQPGSALIDIAYETEKFLDHHRARGTVFVDWDAAWRNWMRRAIEWAPKKGSKQALNAVTPAAVMTLFDV